MPPAVEPQFSSCSGWQLALLGCSVVAAVGSWLLAVACSGQQRWQQQQLDAGSRQLAWLWLGPSPSPAALALVGPASCSPAVGQLAQLAPAVGPAPAGPGWQLAVGCSLVVGSSLVVGCYCIVAGWPLAQQQRL